MYNDEDKSSRMSDGSTEDDWSVDSFDDLGVELLDKLMRWFANAYHAFLNQRFQQHQDGGSNDVIRSSGGSQNSQAHLTAGQSLPNSLKRRQQENGRGSEDAEEGDDSGSQRQGPDEVDPGNTLTDGKFACPFFKRRPQYYKGSRACRSSTWQTVHRLK
jgi:hypothetical protein